ncbi:MAG: hypothetical protein ABJN62_00590 [Halioglobus sp.]
MFKKTLLGLLMCFVLLIAAFNLWGAMTLGKHTPVDGAQRNADANKVVMVFGATGSVGDALLKAAMQADEVEQVYAVTRRLSPRLEQGKSSGRVNVIMHEDFTDYSDMSDILVTVNTVMWGLGTTSIGMDPELYRKIHVDFPIAFVTEWLSARTDAPMSFHYVTGMGTGEQESAQWAKDKGSAERRVAEMAAGTGLRSFAHRSAWIRPTEENANFAMYLGERLLQPGYLVIPGIDLGYAMFEISARPDELPNGALIDNKDAIEYAAAYRNYKGI